MGGPLAAEIARASSSSPAARIRRLQGLHPRPSHIQQGKYHLVDAGYPNRPGYLAPYKGERYHVPDFHRGAAPRTPKEKFNKIHSSKCNVIERAFGVENEVADSTKDAQLSS